MVFLKFLGIADLVAASMLILLHIDYVNARIALSGAFYLIGKGIMFRGDFASVVDAVGGIYIILMVIFGFHTFLTYLVFIWLFQKAFLSIVSY